MARVRFENVELRDGRKLLYKDLSFELADGEMGAVYGPSRTGKSSILLMASGHLPPGAGVVSINGKKPNRKKAGLGPIHDLTPLFDTLTVEEHLVFQGRLYGVRNARARAKELISMYELEPVCNYRVKDLGHIEQFRTGLASLLVHHPDLVLIDEPERGLTDAEWERAHADLVQLQEAGHTILLTTVLSQVAERCQVVVELPSGEVRRG